MTFGERLKLLRSKKKLSQQALSERLGLNRATYARYETNDNQPDYDTLQKLADFFDVTVDYLLGRGPDLIIKEGNKVYLAEAKTPSEKKDKQVSRAFLELPDDVTDEEKEFLQAQLDAQLEIFRKLKGKK